MEETDDPGANTAMFRAFAEQPRPAGVGEKTTNAGAWIAAAVAVAVIVVVVVALATL